VVDYACGDGALSRALLDHADVVRGIDISDGMVAAYNAAAEARGVAPERMCAVAGDIMAAAEGETAAAALAGDEYFGLDAIGVQMALHHVAERERFLARLVERLRTGGVLIIVDWSLEGLEQTLAAKKLGEHAAHHTVATRGFDETVMKGLLVGAGCDPATVDYRLYKEESHIPAEVAKIEGGHTGRFFIAIGRKT